MASELIKRMKQKSGTAATWTAANPLLLDGEIGFEKDTDKFKIGNGISRWNDLGYFTGPVGPQGPAATITVGTVSSGATPSVTNSGTSGAAILNFVLRPGDTGPIGPAGPQGAVKIINVGTAAEALSLSSANADIMYTVGV